MSSSPWLWFSGGLLLIGGEIVLPGVYLLWLGLGALVVGVLVAVFPDLGLTWQLVSFALAMLGTVSLGFVIQRRGAPPAAGELNQELHALVGQRFVAASVPHHQDVGLRLIQKLHQPVLGGLITGFILKEGVPRGAVDDGHPPAGNLEP